MIVAGIGCKTGVSERDVIAALSATLAAHDYQPSALGKLATGGVKRGEKAIFDAARRLGLTVTMVDDSALQATTDRCLTRSQMSLDHAGVPSLSEAAALAAAGTGARLIAPRAVHGGVTCALAISEAPQ